MPADGKSNPAQRHLHLQAPKPKQTLKPLQHARKPTAGRLQGWPAEKTLETCFAANQPNPPVSLGTGNQK